MQNKAEGLRKGQTVEVNTKDGKERGVVMFMGENQIIIKMLESVTSAMAHGYHWAKGDIKSILYKRMSSLKVLDYSSAKPKVKSIF